MRPPLLGMMTPALGSIHRSPASLLLPQHWRSSSSSSSIAATLKDVDCFRAATSSFDARSIVSNRVFASSSSSIPSSSSSSITASRLSVAAASSSFSAPSSSTSGQFSSSSVDGAKKRVVFLGTPEVAAGVLNDLLEASDRPDSDFEVSAIVTQPPASRGRSRRGGQLTPTPVGLAALERGYPEERLFWPASARDASFLSSLRDLNPDLCITAAYGNFLPKAFLSIPRRGTVNIHPSLLPLFRGASPVQRALECGVQETGVSLLFSVLAMDAGPIIAAEKMAVDDHIKAPELLDVLFKKGSQLLLSHLPAILDGSAALSALSQDDSLATHAPKVSSEEGVLDFSLPAQRLHNKVRAFAGWPGTKAAFRIQDAPESSSGKKEEEEEEEVWLKIITTRWKERTSGETPLPLGEEVSLVDDALVVVCNDGSVLEVLEVQPPSKKVMPAKAFWNGLRGRKLLRSDSVISEKRALVAP